MKRGVLHAGLLAGTAMTLVFVTSALAEEAADATRLEKIAVQGAAQSDSPTGAVDGFVAGTTYTGAKTATPITEVPQAISVVGTKELSVRGATKTDEAMRYTAGVFSQPYGSDSDTDWFYIRGFNATQTGVYLDGMPLFANGYGSTLVDPFTLERIEVLKGAASVLYGGSNPGGLANYVSKVANGERIRFVETGVSTNANGTGFLAFDIGDAINDKYAYRVTGRLEGSREDDGFDPGFKGVISPSLRVDLTDSTRLTLLANYTAVDETHIPGTWLPYEGTVVDAPFGRIDPDFNASEPAYDYYTRTQAYFGYEFEHAFDNDWTLRHKARYAHVNVGEQQVLGYGSYASTGVLNRGAFKERTSADTFVADTSLTGTLRTGAFEHELLAGTDYRFYRNASASAFGTAGTINVVNPVYGATTPSATLGADKVLTQQQLGFYAQDQIRFGDGWITTLNARYDRVWSENGSDSGSDGALSGRAGLAYGFDFGLTPYASIATFFNPVIGTVSGGKFAEPETGTQYEVGLKYQPNFVNALFTVALFDLTRQNVTTTHPTTSVVSQTGEVRSRGFELEAKGEVLDNLTATAAFTAYNLEITKDADSSLIGKRPKIAPEMQASFWLEYAFDDAVFAGSLEGLSIGGGVRHVGETYAENANTNKVKSSTLFDAHVGYAKDNWGLDLNVNNLLDTTYVAGCDTQYYCYYGEGRTVMLRAHATW
ncbi:TonB-dependent siderophore receptor [Roseibium sp.]|uniref:TonB-dependent siderophore receptor n=1 Tax=Roseibium sp. TaxID=1936156 RepID=UPI003A97F63D